MAARKPAPTPSGVHGHVAELRGQARQNRAGLDLAEAAELIAQLGVLSEDDGSFLLFEDGEELVRLLQADGQFSPDELAGAVEARTGARWGTWHLCEADELVDPDGAPETTCVHDAYPQWWHDLMAAPVEDLYVMARETQRLVEMRSRQSVGDALYGLTEVDLICRWALGREVTRAAELRTQMMAEQVEELQQAHEARGASTGEPSG